MNLSDLRKISVKKHLRIRFPLSNGMECVVNEHGIAQVPALRAVPSFNLENELEGAQTFLVETLGGAKETPKPRKCTRDEMTTLAKSATGSAAAEDEHED